ncbi:MAG: prolipoprotein diacylglyceryl transferase, partial [Gemmatimonadota bacterium]|nr:prolipoprotein diacylglyceryl transferase [Gemmatimonadota bacterium]
LGRVGCFLVQDDYGMPTSLPWGMKFPEGLPPSTAQSMNANFGIPIPEGVNPLEVLAVHPTQLYEAAIMLGVFFVLWRMRAHRHGTGWLFGAYLTFAGSERFLIEFLRAKDDRLLGVFTVAQFTSVVLIAIGINILVRLKDKAPVKIPKAAAILFPPSEKPA